MSKKVSIWSCFMLFTFFLVPPSTYAQDNQAVLAAADTTNFSINANGGWLLYNSYMAVQGSDTIRLELILQHDNNINWIEEQYIGKIKTDHLRPDSERLIPFTLDQVNYQLHIDTGGKCYLKIVSGTTPANNPVVLPFIIIFKK